MPADDGLRTLCMGYPMTKRVVLLIHNAVLGGAKAVYGLEVWQEKRMACFSCSKARITLPLCGSAGRYLLPL